MNVGPERTRSKMSRHGDPRDGKKPRFQRNTPFDDGVSDRTESGRFAKGNKCSVGTTSVSARKRSEWRELWNAAVTTERMKETIEVLFQAVRDGRPWAVQEVLNRTLGKVTDKLEVEDKTPPQEKRVHKTLAEIFAAFPDRDRSIPYPPGLPQPTKLLKRLTGGGDGGDPDQ